jgi:predicted TIM-barrel fold metal-dependent hydrolase
MHECCKRANDRGWPHQIHVGTHNLRASSPLPLRALAQRYPKMKLVQLHCWPFIEEAGHLAKLQPNVYIDTCWEPVLSPAFLEQALHTWLSFVPAHKIMLSHDSTSVEMAAGSSLFTRDALSAAMDRQRRTLGVSADMALRLAQDMLHNNAVRVYGCGELLG